ncbi:MULTISPECIES: hypothetical protein [Prevotella]|uniref:CHAT domain-containing protein n=1 Tax=Prevotella melaninogenica TaxID=28132 RepID=A0ABX7XSL2_9BACT|nr:MULTISPECIES: hypothetical protein [Prevotella]QUB76689.1 hypothetical protein J5A58_13395 [Prevotella melaninogenica]
MRKVLIAFNNDRRNSLHDFMESCADEAKQNCLDQNITFSSICPPELTEKKVMEEILNHHLCFIAGHGDINGIYNEKDEYILSTKTTNYNFIDKGLYCIACSCAQELYPHLQGIGLRFFVGYNRKFYIRGEYDPFIKSAMSGFFYLLSGDSIKDAKRKMLEKYDEQIKELENIDILAAAELLHNRESLVFEGKDYIESPI